MFKTAQKSAASASAQCAGTQQIGFNTQRKSTDAATLRTKKPSLAKNPVPTAPGTLSKGVVHIVPSHKVITSTTKATKKSISRTGITQLNNSSIVNKSESIHSLNKLNKNKIYQTDVKKAMQPGSGNKSKPSAQLNTSKIRIQSRLVDNLNLSTLEALDARGYSTQPNQKLQLQLPVKKAQGPGRNGTIE